MAAALRTSLVLLLLALVLSGCWMGARFYGPPEVQSPIAPGRYRVLPPKDSEEAKWLRVAIRADRFTKVIPSDSGPFVIGFVPLPGRAGYFIGWDEPSKADRADQWASGYALLQVQAGEYRYAVPSCPAMRAVAEAAGAAFSPDPKVPNCFFRDRASLEAAFREVIHDPGLEWVRLLPVVKAR